MSASPPRGKAQVPNIEFAPFGVLRVAAWTLQTLDPFGCPELLDAAAGLATARAPRGVDALYRQTLLAERAALWARTAGDQRFMKALALANPSLMQRVRERGANPLTDAPDKRTRHLETTLYRQLARAVGRTEPFGAWSGVGIVELGPQTQLQRVPDQRVVAPDLGFYSKVLREISSRRASARLARYRLNPTLGRRADGLWGYWAPPRVNAEGYCELDSNTVLDEALERLLSLDTFSISDAERALGVEPGVLDDFFFEQLMPQGVLVGGFGLPPFFSDPWDALERIEAELPVPQLSAWVRLREGLRTVCQRVEDEFDAASCDLVVEANLEAQALVRCFGAELQLEDVPDLALYLDSGAPWRLSLGPDFVAALTEGVARDEADTSGGVRRFNEALRRTQCEQIGNSGLPVRGLAENCLVDLSRSNDWPRVSPQEYFPDWPLRTAIADIADRSDLTDVGSHSGHRLSLGPLNLVDDIASPLSRFFPVLRRQDADGAQALLHWLRQAHAAVQHPELAALSEGDVPAPNAISQPDLGLRRFSLWSVAPGVRSLAGLRISALAERGLVALRDAERDYSLVSLSAVNLVRRDPALQLLMMSSLRFPQATRVASTSAEQEPRAEAQPDRIQADTLAALGRRQGIERFVTWAGAIGQRRGRQVVQRHGTSPLLVGVDSPLAVSALLEGVSENWHYLQFEAATNLPYLRNGAEQYVARLVLPFRRPAQAV